MPDDARLATVAVENGVATITINRPEQRNAMSLELVAALHDAVDDVTRRDDVRVCAITGAGRAFCAGMDLKQVIVDADAGGSGDPELPYRVLRGLAELTIKIANLDAVTVAVVNGAAIGGGCGLACVCDLAISHADAKLGFPEVDLSLCPAVITPWVVRKMGAGPARAALLMGGVMSGEAAHALGIVDEIARDRDGLAALASSVIGRLAEGGAGALRVTKRLLDRIDGEAIAERVLEGARLSADVVATEKAQRRLIARLVPPRG